MLVNSNPATIMTDPEVATTTYIEPLLPGPVRAGDRARAARRAAADARRPDRAEPGQGAARGRHARALRRRADRRRLRRDRPRRGPRALPRDDDRGRAARAPQRDRPHRRRRPEPRSPRSGCRSSSGRRSRSAARAAASSATEDELARVVGARAGGVADRAGAARGVGARVGRVRARGDARPRRQRRDRLLDREPRPDGRAHRRQRVRRAAADAHRQAVPDAARPGDRRDPRGRRRDRRLERPVRGQPRHRRDRGDRDEPARVALERAREQGDGLPDREDRRAARGRLHAPGDPQRHHAGDAGELRAGDRLLRGQVAAVRVREVPRRRGRADHAHEVGRRGDGDRADVQAGVRQGAALARARLETAATRTTTTSCWTPLEQPGAERFDHLLEALRRGVADRGAPPPHEHRPVVPARARRAGGRSATAPFGARERTFKSVDTCAAEFAARTPYYYSAGSGRAPAARAARSTAATARAS